MNRRTSLIDPFRPVAGEGGVVCTSTCLDIRSVNFFLPPQDLFFTVRDGGASENAAKLP